MIYSNNMMANHINYYQAMLELKNQLLFNLFSHEIFASVFYAAGILSIVYIIYERIWYQSHRAFHTAINMWRKTHNSYLIIIADCLIDIDDDKYYRIGSSSSIMKLLHCMQDIDTNIPLDIILHTTGGDSDNCKLILDALMNHVWA